MPKTAVESPETGPTGRVSGKKLPVGREREGEGEKERKGERGREKVGRERRSSVVCHTGNEKSFFCL